MCQLYCFCLCLCVGIWSPHILFCVGVPVARRVGLGQLGVVGVALDDAAVAAAAVGVEPAGVCEQSVLYCYDADGWGQVVSTPPIPLIACALRRAMACLPVAADSVVVFLFLMSLKFKKIDNNCVVLMFVLACVGLSLRACRSSPRFFLYVLCVLRVGREVFMLVIVMVRPDAGVGVLRGCKFSKYSSKA